MEQVQQEVSNTDQSLAACIANGSVPRPPVMDWKDWLIWRKSAGKRPKVGLGDQTPTTLRQESLLYKATMQGLYGAGWRALLEELQARQADEEEEEAASVAAGGASVTEASVASGSAPVTPQRLRQTLLEEFDAAAGTSAEYQQRMEFVMEQLESLGEPVTPAERMKVALRREYGELIAGKSQVEQKKQLKLVFEEVLLGVKPATALRSITLDWGC